MYSRERASERASKRASKSSKPRNAVGANAPCVFFHRATNSALAATTTVVTSYGTARAHPVKPIDPTPFDLPRPGSFLSYHKTDTRRLTRIKKIFRLRIDFIRSDRSKRSYRSMFLFFVNTRTDIYCIHTF